MPRKKLCDGSEVEWEPKWVEETCDECGSVIGKEDVAEPSFHGEPVRKGRELVCLRCGAKFGDYATISALAEATLKKAAERWVNDSSPFLWALRK
jgi:hypothetical protein